MQYAWFYLDGLKFCLEHTGKVAAKANSHNTKDTSTRSKGAMRIANQLIKSFKMSPHMICLSSYLQIPEKAGNEMNMRVVGEKYQV